MSGEIDKLQGKVKEAAGVLADDEQLEREGRGQQAAGSAKEKLGDAQAWAEEKIDEATKD
jgi:uncharacterized protein YjbJ (UPF0337 family)